MRIFSKKIFDQNKKETGAILWVIKDTPTNNQQKNTIETQLIQYAFDRLYPGEALVIYREMYVDSPSITIIKNTNNLPEEFINI